jgi:hypothetical protein
MIGQDVTDSEDGGRKSPFSSKTIHFNWISAVLVPAIWPFLPKKFTANPYAIHSVTAWFAIGNVALRFLTTTAVTIFKPKEKPSEQTSKK